MTRHSFSSFGRRGVNRSLNVSFILAEGFLLTASHLELAGVRVERVVVEHHATGDGDADPGWRRSKRQMR